MNLAYIHFDEHELTERVAEVAHLGQVARWWRTDEVAKFMDNLPDVLIVSLDRLPSHGRAYVEWLWEAKKRHHIPVVFVGGSPDKVAQNQARVAVPEDGRALYCSRDELPMILAEL